MSCRVSFMGLVKSNGSLPPGLSLMSPVSLLPRNLGQLLAQRSNRVWDYTLLYFLCHLTMGLIRCYKTAVSHIYFCGPYDSTALIYIATGQVVLLCWCFVTLVLERFYSPLICFNFSVLCGRLSQCFSSFQRTLK